MDSRDTEGKKLFPVPDSSTIEWLGSEISTGIIPEGPEHPGGRFFSEILWTDRTIYDRNSQLRPERLAAVAMFLASDYFGWLQPHLASSDYQENRAPLDQMTRTKEALNAGIAFADRLMADSHLLYLLTQEQREGFHTMKKIFLDLIAKFEGNCSFLLAYRDQLRAIAPDAGGAAEEAIQIAARRAAADTNGKRKRPPIPKRRRKN